MGANLLVNLCVCVHVYFLVCVFTSLHVPRLGILLQRVMAQRGRDRLKGEAGGSTVKTTKAWKKLGGGDIVSEVSCQ